MEISYIGIDPGRTGAAGMLSGSGKLGAIAGWKPVRRNKRYRYSIVSWKGRGGEESPGCENRLVPLRAGAVGKYLADIFSTKSLKAEVACEDSYIGKNPRSGWAVARFSGGVVAPVEELFSVQSEWVLPGEWRASILGIRRNTKRAAAKQASLRYIPARIPRLSDALLKIGIADHYTDAAGVAEWLRTKPKR